VSEGLGLGLTLVKSLVEMHGGRVDARSDGPGRGSEFIVRLPLAPDAPPAAPPAADAPPATAAAPAARSARVLVVDDSVDGAESLALLLRLAGYDVRVAHDGPTALRASAAARPEVVVLDIGLPNGMDGYEVARRLRAQPGGDHMTLIALTGYGQDDDRRRSGAAGFAAHLVKPVDPPELEAVIARLLAT
jgi:CheY-like chemotaxis protein